MTRPDHSSHRSWRQRRSTPIVVGVALTLVWVALSWWQPTTTWHLAPLLVVLTPLGTAAQIELPQRLLARVTWTAAGTALALAATAALHLAGMLDGPALLGPAVWVEDLLLIAAGTVGAAGWITWTRFREGPQN